MVDEDPPHRPRRHGEEVHAVLAFDPREVDHPHVGLVDQRGGGEGVAGPSPEVAVRDLAQLLVDLGVGALEGAGLAPARRCQQSLDRLLAHSSQTSALSLLPQESRAS